MPWPVVLSRGFSLLCLGVLALALAYYPLSASWIGAIIVAYPVLLIWRWRLWLLGLPALIPVADMAQYTGWFFIEELDLLLLATAAVCYWHGPARGATPPLPRLSWGFRLGLCLLLASIVMGIYRGLQPLPAIDANAFTSYYSPYNALRLAKGWLWPLILLPPLRWTIGPRLQGLQRYLIPGLMAGLALVCLAAIRERMLFPGLLNFSADYRSTAPFSSMHTGGAALDGYLALVAPLAALWLRAQQGLIKNTLALMILACSAYAGLSTFSRGLYLGFALAITLHFLSHRQRLGWQHWLGLALVATTIELIFSRFGYRALLAMDALAAIAMAKTVASQRLQARTVLLLAGTLAALSLAIPFSHSEYSEQRFASSGSDLRGRLVHWRHVLAVMDDQPSTRWLGMGLGTFPAAYYWHNPLHEQPASYRYIDEQHNRYLLLLPPRYPAGYGELLRILQRVAVQPGHPYRVSLDIRTGATPVYLHLKLCERQLLYPRSCLAAPVNQVPNSSRWRRLHFDWWSGLLGMPDGLWTPPVQLEIAAEGENSALAIDNVSLLDQSTGHELLRNGSFTDANDYWFFSSDHYHLPWHIKNLALNLYFELGLPGVIAFSLLLLSTLSCLLRQAARDAGLAVCWIAALAAFLAVGIFDSLVDVPRITLLFVLVLFTANLQAESST